MTPNCKDANSNPLKLDDKAFLRSIITKHLWPIPASLIGWNTPPRITGFLAKFATQGQETTSLQTRDCGVDLDVIDVTAGRQKTKQKASIELERRNYVLILDRGYVTLQHYGDPRRKGHDMEKSGGL